MPNFSEARRVPVGRKPSTALQWCPSLGGLGSTDLDRAGGKGANLGELVAAGFTVPPGFVITTAAPIRLNRLQRLIGPIILELLPRHPYPMEVSAWIAPNLGPNLEEMVERLIGARFTLQASLPDVDHVVQSYVPPNPGWAGARRCGCCALSGEPAATLVPGPMIRITGRTSLKPQSWMPRMSPSSRGPNCSASPRAPATPAPPSRTSASATSRRLPARWCGCVSCCRFCGAKNCSARSCSTRTRCPRKPAPNSARSPADSATNPSWTPLFARARGGRPQRRAGLACRDCRAGIRHSGGDGHRKRHRSTDHRHPGAGRRYARGRASGR